MTRPSSTPRGERIFAEEAARAPRRWAALHHVSGVTIDCCEQGETDCPCVCHDEQEAQR